MKRCLVVVDYQNDFVAGSLGFAKAAELEKYIAKKVHSYHCNHDDVIFTLDTHDENYLESQEGILLPVVHCVKGTPGHQLYGQIASMVLKEDRCFYKHAFGSDALYEHLKTNTYDHIELVGLVSNICVLANAVLAKTAQPETSVSVDAKCTASHDEQLHEAALDVMVGMQIAVTGRLH